MSLQLLSAQAKACVILSAQIVRAILTDHYARVGGISLVELNMLEKEFLNAIDWRLLVRSFGLPGDTTATTALLRIACADASQLCPSTSHEASSNRIPGHYDQ